MTRSVGVFVYRSDVADMLWNQCDEPGGRHRGLEFRHRDAGADVILTIGLPVTPSGDPRPEGWARRAAKLQGRLEASRAEVAWGAIGREARDVTVLWYEPGRAVRDEWYGVAARYASHVAGPDDRAPVPTVLPSWWTLQSDLHRLRQEGPTDKPIPLVAINSGTMALPGHSVRMDFFRRAAREGLDVTLFGKSLPADVRGHGAVLCKGNVLRPARFTLVIENDDAGDKYVTEKLWDALACWSLPVYHGPRAPERLIPGESFVRLPDLGEGGVEVLREVLAKPTMWDTRLEAIAEARRAALDELRMVEWFRGVLEPGGVRDLWSDAARGTSTAVGVGA